MQTVIVPVDFSPVSWHAAQYAVRILTGHYGVEMIIYHLYEKEADSASAEQQLENMRLNLRDVGYVKVSTLAEKGNDFESGLSRLAAGKNADLIIMGITGRSAIGQSLVGSHTLRMVNTGNCPVLIVPGEAEFRDIRNVLLTSDFKNVEQTMPAGRIRNMLKTFKPQLHIMNTDPEHYVALTEDYQREKDVMTKLFADFNPECYFLSFNDIDEAIQQFASDKHIDLIIMVHREQGLYNKLFVKSHTKKLAYQGQIPVFALKPGA
jgi:nucleotide-binding universal stress UspA family protein